MKYKILSTLIASALLGGCFGNDDRAVHNTQAFDPAVANMDVSYSCTDGTAGAAGVTDGYGKVNITPLTVVTTPETCSLLFVARSNSVDMSNGKSMAGVSYTVPKGMSVAGNLTTGTPLSTLIAKSLGDEPYTEAAATQVLTDLGLDSLLNDGVSISDLLLNTEAVAASLPAASKSKLLATTAVLSDTILNADTSATAEELSAAAEAISATVLTTYPLYPSSTADGTGDDIFLEIPKSTVDGAVADPEATVTLPPAQEAVPVDPTTPPTGGTGGTGGGSDDSTGA
ncbi:hypothetical protein [Psychromonas ossibalaenae]|uniref:hypothetical protein n=1 Tax=Psychromonas ossibalaenae TaxID=444922 RepID=UPI000381A671|nr:hypothetical protein [Psychromonas ossibalaenae]